MTETFAAAYRRGYETGVEVERKRCKEIAQWRLADAREKLNETPGDRYWDGAQVSAEVIIDHIRHGK